MASKKMISKALEGIEVVFFDMKADLEDIRKRTTDVKGYFDSMSQKERDILYEMFENYVIKEDVISELREVTENICVVAFSAEWCKDCKNSMPVMRHLEEKIGLEVRVFGKIKTAPLDPNVKWAVPPSPPESNEWGITAIPYFFFFDKTDGERVAVLIEKPMVKETLEEEILYVLKHK